MHRDRALVADVFQTGEDLIEIDRRNIKINDLKLSKHRETFHGAIGYLPQDFGLYENMTPVEYLHYFALTNAIYESDSRKELIENIIKSVGLWDRRNSKIKTFKIRRTLNKFFPICKDEKKLKGSLVTGFLYLFR